MRTESGLYFILVGLLVHMMKLTNYFPTWDSMYSMDTPITNQSGTGRFLFGVSGTLLSSRYDLHWLEGILAIALFGVVLILIFELCSITKKSHRIILGILFMVFPSFASVLCYTFAAEDYAVSFLLAIGAVYLCMRGKSKKSAALAAVFIAFSFGIYQIYVPTAAICFLYAIVCELLQGREVKEELKKGGRFCFAVLAGLLLYLIINTVVMQVTGTHLTDYQGVSTVGQMTLKDIGGAFVRMVLYAGFFHVGALKISFYAVWNLLTVGVIFLFWLKDVLLNGNIPGKKRLLIFISLVLSVFATYIFLFVSTGTQYHMIMQIGNYFIYLGLFLIIETTDRHFRGAAALLAKKAAVGLLAVLCFYHFVNDNVAYKQMEVSYQRSVFEAEEMLSRIDEANVNRQEELAMIGNVEFASFGDAQDIEALPVITGAKTTSFLVTPIHFRQFFKYYFKRSYVLVSEEKIQEIKNTAEYKEMDTYPYGDCIKIIQDTIVVKLN